jgi:hypothetical protein
VSVVQIDGQHSDYSWMHEHELLASERVHDNTKAYFRAAVGIRPDVRTRHPLDINTATALMVALPCISRQRR